MAIETLLAIVPLRAEGYLISFFLKERVVQGWKKESALHRENEHCPPPIIEVRKRKRGAHESPKIKCCIFDRVRQ